VFGGAVSAVTPCVLPVLPALLAVSSSGHRRRVWGVVIGLELSFFLIGILLAAALSSLGLPASILQWIAAGLLVLLGLTLIVPKLNNQIQLRLSRLTSRLRPAGGDRSGFFGGLLAGAPLGLVWAPCAGPILAGVTVAAASMRFGARTFAVMAAYAVGMLGPLAAIGFGGRRAMTYLRGKVRRGRGLEVAMGLVLLLTATVVGLGWANSINRFLAEKVNLTSTPTAALEKDALKTNVPRSNDTGSASISVEEIAANGYPESDELVDYGPAPEVKGITNWYNSAPSSFAALKGKVVLIDFWTYTCINCIRTLPYLKKWYGSYKDEGFVVLGVHSPEFSFEKDPGNVGRAVRDFGIEYPVANDPNHKTWDAFYNRYWPAHYLIDKNGRIRSVHYGEGEYVETENEIRHLLSMEATKGSDEDLGRRPLTPESYLGYARGDGVQPLAHDYPYVYTAPEPAELPLDYWAYSGTWTVGEESGTSGPDAGLLLRFRAADVHLVARPGGGSAGWMRVTGAGVDRMISIDSDRLYTIRSGEYTSGVLRFEFSEGVEVFAFTFG
jgi:cytochrome c biogenesis protein CcdA/thiol-disulfide isomerase/thioredoxin